MIPQFPEFKAVELTDLESMQEINSLYEPYSDFNFASIYSYNTNGLNRISILNNNLVIILQDYHTGIPFLTFLGKNEQNATVSKLTEYARSINIDDTLKMVPEISTETIDTDAFVVQEDRDNYDYIYNIEELAALEGNEHHVNRRQFVKFTESYPSCKPIEIDYTNSDIVKQIFKLFDLWAYQTSKSEEESQTEKGAIGRFLEAAKAINIFAIGVYDENRLINFAFYELLANNYVMGHFGKADKNYSGLYRFSQTISCQMLFKKDSKYLNLEQDLGIIGLRQTKTLWRPTKYLKKYSVKKVDTI